MVGEKQLVVIGVKDYSGKPWRKLRNTLVDINRISGILTGKYGFTEEERLVDREASRYNIINRLESLCKNHTTGASLVVYFAGHGFMDPVTQKGFWIPCEATGDKSTWINNESILEVLEGSAASHILLISDSCFSGTFNSGAPSVKVHYDHDLLDALHSRWILTAGRKEPVSDGSPGDGSPFNQLLCDLLEDNNRDTLSAGDLFAELKNQMFTRLPYLPTYGSFDGAHHAHGQLILRANRTTGSPIPSYPKFPLPETPGLKAYIPRTFGPYDQRQHMPYGFELNKEGLPLRNLILTDRKILLLGGAGSGKTIEFAELMRRLQNREAFPVPVYQRFNTYADQEIDRFLPPGWTDVPDDRLLLLLDGLDEIPESQRTVAFRKLKNFITLHPHISYVCTCRTNFYDLAKILDGFTAFQIDPVPLREVKAYANQEFDVDGDSFLTEVLANKLIDLVQIPFFLNILLQTYQAEDKLSPDRGRLMLKALVDQTKKDSHRYSEVLDPPLGLQEMLDDLSRIAYIMERLGRNYLEASELYQIFPNPTTQHRLRFQPAFRHDPRSDRWTFEHNNFQEFLAADVLGRQPVAKIIEIISLPGLPKIRPTWANTLSFFISLAPAEKRDAVVDWVREHDPEYIVKFERDKIVPDLRVSIGRKILDDYNSKSIVVSSPKFDYQDLARFAGEGAFVIHLLNILRSEERPGAPRNNTLSVLSFIDARHLGSLKTDIRECIYNLAMKEGTDYYFRYLLLRAIGSLQVLDALQLTEVINKYRRHKNEYIRAGLYKLILDLNKADQHFDILLEGLDLATISNPVEDRGPGHLMDEELLLHEALGRINTADSIKRLLAYLKNPSLLAKVVSREPEGLLDRLIAQSSRLYSKANDLYDSVLQLWTMAMVYYDQRLANRFLPFFTETGTPSKAFWSVWQDTRIGYSDKIALTGAFIDEGMLDEFVHSYQDDKVTMQEVIDFHAALVVANLTSTAGESVALLLDKKINAVAPVAFSYPRPSERGTIFQRRAQESFDLLFDPDRFEDQINAIFDAIGTDQITLHDLYGVRHSGYNPDEDYFPHTASEFLRSILIDFNKIDRAGALLWLKANAFLRFRMRQAYAYVMDRKGYQVSVSTHQQATIAGWVDDEMRHADLDGVALSDWEFMRLLWHFVTVYSLPVTAENWLSFTLSFDYGHSNNLSDTNTIDQLEQKVDLSRLHDRVIRNLGKLEPGSSVWVENAAYALRKHLTEAEPLITAYLLDTEDCSNRVSDLLRVLYDHQSDHQGTKSIAEEAQSRWLRQEAIQLLWNTSRDHPFIRAWANNTIEQPAEAVITKLFATNQLIRLKDVHGLQYMAQLTETPLSYREIALIGRLNTFDNQEALLPLLQLLRHAKQQQPRDDDFGYFVSKVTEAIMDLGASSHENFAATRAGLLQFQTDHRAELGDLTYLSLVIQRIEERLLLRQSTEITLRAAMEEYNGLLLLEGGPLNLSTSVLQ